MDRYHIKNFDYRSLGYSSIAKRSPVTSSEGVTLKKILGSEVSLEDMIEYLHDKALEDRQYDNVIAVNTALRTYHTDLDYEFFVEELSEGKKACFNFWSPVKTIQVSMECYPEGMIIPKAVYISDETIPLVIAGAEVGFSQDLQEISETLTAINRFLSKVC